MKIKELAALLCVLAVPLAAMAGPTPGGADADGDGVENAFDNCSTISNSSQKDQDHDGCGDLCECDFTQNSQCGIEDFGIFASSFGRSEGLPGYFPGADLDCNGTVGISDFGIYANNFGRTAGPSGITHPGRDPIACP